MTRYLCHSHTAWVDVLDNTAVHITDALIHHHEDDPLSTERGRVTSVARVRRAQPPLPGDDEPEGVPA